ncbi:MAG: hypothetical protein U9N85_13070 [Bacteroidota bacterium]|nr:hypothetical protein [Bacteroidota bacterium]
MTLSISIAVAALSALAVWLIFSVKKSKNTTRYTKDEDRKSFSDTEKMLSNIKDAPQPKEEEVKEPEKIEKKVPKPKKKKKPRKKALSQSDSFNVADALVASELINRKNRKKE